MVTSREFCQALRFIISVLLLCYYSLLFELEHGRKWSDTWKNVGLNNINQTNYFYLLWKRSYLNPGKVCLGICKETSSGRYASSWSLTKDTRAIFRQGIKGRLSMCLQPLIASEQEATHSFSKVSRRYFLKRVLCGAFSVPRMRVQHLSYISADKCQPSSF